MSVKSLRIFAVVFALLLNISIVPATQASTPSLVQEEMQIAPRPADFVVAMEQGHRVCRPATREESRGMRRRDPNLELRAISSGSNSGANLMNQSEQAQEGGLKIILRGTPQLDSYPQAKAAFLRAAKQWEMLISSPITVVIDVDYGPTRFGEPWDATTLGSTQNQFVGGTTNYQAVRNSLVAKASSTAESALLQSLPVGSASTDLGNTQSIYAGAAVFRALGSISPVADPDGERNQLGDPPSIGFNSNFGNDFDPRDGIDSDKYDFESTAAHEIGHALGFTSWVGSLELDPDDINSLTTLDLFRFRPGMTLGRFQTASRIQASGGQQIFYAGGSELPLSTGRADHTGGDGEQASHWKANEQIGWYVGIMDPTGDTGERGPISESDVAAFDAMGYAMNTGEAALASGVSRQGYIQAPNDRNRGTLAIRQYRIDVPSDAAQLQVALTGDTDVDLYVRYGSPITLNSNGYTNADFVSESPENQELIRVGAPTLRAGTYYIAVGNYSSDSSFYSVSATVAKNDAITLASGVTQSGTIPAPAEADGFTTNATQFQVQVPNGATRLQINLSGNQDVDLYVRYGQRVTLYPDGNTEADFRSESPSSNESVTISNSTNPQLRAGTYFIAVGNYGPGAASFTVTATINGTVTTNNVTSVVAASFSGAALASESIAAAFGTGLATSTQIAATVPLPTSLGGTTVKVRDSAGAERFAPLFFVSSTQVNYQIPPGTTVGTATVTITSGAGSVSVGTAKVESVAPGLFAADGSGQGVVSGYALRVKANGVQSIELLARYDAAQGKIVPIPLDLGPVTDQVYLILFGTGLRFRSSLSTAALMIGGVNASVLFAGAQGNYVGLDQINALVPRSLIGRGDVDILFAADGRTSNRVRINIK